MVDLQGFNDWQNTRVAVDDLLGLGAVWPRRQPNYRQPPISQQPLISKLAPNLHQGIYGLPASAPVSKTNEPGWCWAVAHALVYDLLSDFVGFVRNSIPKPSACTANMSYRQLCSWNPHAQMQAAWLGQQDILCLLRCATVRDPSLTIQRRLRGRCCA